jgi:rhodanese-related sulfurtransferase
MTMMTRIVTGAAVGLAVAGAALAGDTAMASDDGAGPFAKAACYVFGGREDCRTVQIFDANECIVKIHPEPLPDLDPAEIACLRDEVDTRKLYLRKATLIDAATASQINVGGEAVVEVLVGHDEHGGEVWETRNADAFDLIGDPARTRQAISRLSTEFCAGESRMVGGGTSGGTITADEAFRRAAEGEITLIDIRLPAEWQRTGVGVHAIPITKHQSIYHFVDQLKKVDGIDERPIALICAEGVRSANMQEMLMQFGFQNVIDVHDGMDGNADGPGWIESGLPVTPYTPAQADLTQ